MARCPICRKVVATRAQNAFFPFCSERCRLVDLGKWLGGEYRIPVAPPPEGETATTDISDSGESE
jgi:endogenous inhibitor of DNA gyrase (YacG/DUF329 family)